MIIDYAVRVPIEEIRAILMQGHLENYKRVYGKSAGQVDFDAWCDRPFEDFIGLLDDAGIDKILFHAKDVETTFGRKLGNDVVHATCQRAPDRILFSASVDPHKGQAALDELEYAVKELGAVEVNFQLFELKLFADDPLMRPIYQRLCDWQVPVGLHTGINFSNAMPMEYGNPGRLDRVACEFPDLKIIASPPGFPWVLELIAVAWRHPNVHIGTGPVRPKYFGKPGTGWEPLITYGDNVLQDKLIFGTSWPLLPLKRSIEEVRELPMKSEVVEKWLGGNLARVIGKDRLAAAKKTAADRSKSPL
jgi:hypothetical protein